MHSKDLYKQDALYLDKDSELLEGTTKFVKAITRWNRDEGLEECARSVCCNRRNRDAYLQELREWLKAKEEKALWQRLQGEAADGEQLESDVEQDVSTSSQSHGKSLHSVAATSHSRGGIFRRKRRPSDADGSTKRSENLSQCSTQ